MIWKIQMSKLSPPLLQSPLLRISRSGHLRNTYNHRHIFLLMQILGIAVLTIITLNHLTELSHTYSIHLLCTTTSREDLLR